MELSGQAQRMTIFIGEQDSHGSHSLSHEIVRRAHASAIAGITVFRGVEGYGASSHLHTAHILSLSDDLPICIVIVDSAAAIERFAVQLEMRLAVLNIGGSVVVGAAATAAGLALAAL